jgi:hypothetical protein
LKLRKISKSQSIFLTRVTKLTTGVMKDKLELQN